jgi:CBS domain-containing protein
MTARDLMTSNPACCTMDTPLQDVARMMLRCDCGEIPVVERDDLKKPVGVVTDRDIVCRAIAKGRNPTSMSAGDVMSSPAVTARQSDQLDAIRQLMESHQIRRIPIVDEGGQICGIVSLADIARRDTEKQAGQVVKEVSAPAR